MPNDENGLRPPYLVLALCVALVLAVAMSGSFDSGLSDLVSSSGAVAAETRNATGDVRSIDMNGPVDAVIQIGDVTSIEVEAGDELRSHITTDVQNGTLRIGFNGKHASNSPLRARVTVPRLETLRVGGSGDAEVNGLNGGRFALIVEGSGDVRANGTVERTDVTIRGSGDVDLSELNTADPTIVVAQSGNVELGNVTGGTTRVDVRGSGDVKLSGRAERVEVTAGGSGDVDASELDAQNGRVDVRGSGDVEVKVQTLLEVTHLSGSGDVTNHGSGRTVTTDMGHKRD